MIATGVGVIVAAVLEVSHETGIAGFGRCLLGALVAVVALPAATQVGLLVGAAVFGLRVRQIVIGAMRQVAAVKIGRVTVTLRALPVVLRSEIGPWRSPVIPRCWLAGVTSALFGLATVAAAWWYVAGPFGRGFALTATAVMLFKLWPSRKPLATSTGWLLFRLPRMTGSTRDEFCAGPYAARANELLQDGRVDEAQACVDELAERHPDLHLTASCLITMYEARGEYAQAVGLLLQQISSGKLSQRDMVYGLAGLSGLALAGVEAGQLPAEDILPVAKKALQDSISAGYPKFELSGTRGLLALLEDDPQRAVELASTGARYNTSPLSRADDYATLARAHMALRDNAAARAALDRAEALAEWWPRVRETRDRLSVH